MAPPEWAAGWTAPVERQQLTVAPQAAAGLAALLDAEPSLAAAGAPLPLLWHWVALAEWPPMRITGADGHPATGGFMPPVPYPRRMWLGVTVEVTTPPTIGADVVVERSVTDIVEKGGRDGLFAIVTVTTTVTATDSAPLLVEIARFAYRPATAPGAPGAPAAPPAPPAPPAPRDSTAPRPLDVGSGEWLTNADGIWTARPNPVVLARYSALTANGHRIHYDLPYATQVEGYPSLLVHGPLMATIVSESVRRDHPDRELVGFTCRAQRPYFLGSDATIRLAGSADDRVELELSDGAGEAGSPANLTATVTMR